MSWDFSSSITLAKDDYRSYRTLRFVVFMIAVIATTLFAYTLLFPVRYFHFDHSIDSLANTITRPQISPHGTTFSVAHPFVVDRVKFTMTLPEDAPPVPPATRISVSKSYETFLSPITQETPPEHDTSLPFPDGTLIASSSGVFVTSGYKKHAFDTEQTLAASGYTFDAIRESTSEQRSMYKNGGIMMMTSKHPDGTRFATTDTDQVFLYSSGALHALTNSPAEGAIPVQFASRTQKATCALVQRRFSSKTYTCDVDLSEISQFDGKRYTFTIENIPSLEIAKVTLAFSATPHAEVFSQRLGELRSTFDKQYQ